MILVRHDIEFKELLEFQEMSDEKNIGMTAVNIPCMKCLVMSVFRDHH